jgi:biopolymer transport protein ExbD
MRTSTRRGYRNIIEDDLELMPLMNLFVAMIPMLLLSAVFLNVTVIDMKTPADASEASGEKQHENLLLAVTIKDDYYVVEGRGLEKRVIARQDADADAQLADALSGIVSEHPDNQDVIIISQPNTHYGDIVTVMDISRDNGLPGVSLLGAD